MSTCQKGAFRVGGENHQDGRGIDSILLAFAGACANLLNYGRTTCVGSCDSGICKFGLTRVDARGIRIIPDADGNGVTVTISAEGECFCGSVD